VGVIIFSPVLASPVARTLGAPLPTVFGTVGRLAMDNAARQPRRTAATASALMIGMALVSALTIFAFSISDSLNAAIDRVVGAEFIVANSAQRPFPSTIADSIEELDDAAVVARTTFAPAQVSGEQIATTDTFVSGVDTESISDVLNLEFSEGTLADLDDATVLLDSTTATNNDLTVGDQVTLTFSTGEEQFEVAGIYEPAGFFSGYIVTTQALVDAGLTGGDTFVYVKAAEGADLDALRASIEAILADYPTVEVQSQAELKEQIQSNVNTLLGVMVLLLGLAIFIAILGIVNTLLLSVLERTREIGMLRAVGATRRQIRRMVVLEAMVIALFGAVIGVVLGVVFAAALQRTLADQGIDVLTIPWVALIVFLVVAALVGMAAAFWPAYRAGKLDVLRAVTTE
jgi:putative ABC transport system permease protein